MRMPEIGAESKRVTSDGIAIAGAHLEGVNGERMAQIMNARSLFPRASTNPDTANQRKERRDHRRVSHPSAPLRQEHRVVVDGVLRACTEVCVESGARRRMERHQPAF